MASPTRYLLRCGLACLVSASLAAAPPGGGDNGAALSARIPQQSLADALAAFIEQTGVQLIYLSSLVEGRTSHAVSPGLPPKAALTQLLAGTGLDFLYLNSRTVKIFATSKPARPRPDAQPNTPLSPAPRSTLEEVVVSATKRDQALGTVPLSAYVLGSDTLNALGIKGLEDVAAFTPGVEYDFSTQWGGGVLTNLSIRGVDSNVGAATTAVYIDEAPVQARNGFFGSPAAMTFDLQRVEILRGPQGTLFGAGAEGGAMRFIPNEASTTTFSEYYSTEIATTQHGAPSYETGLAAGGPLVEGLVGMRISAWYREDGGYVDRVDPFSGTLVAGNSNETVRKAFRVGWALEPVDALRLTPSVSYQSTRREDTPSFYEYLSDPDKGIFRSGKLLAQPSQDSFVLTSLKVDASLGSIALTAITSYFDRTARATIDTTNVAGLVYFGGFGNPLGPAYPTSYADATPTQTSLHHIVLAQELRLNSIDDRAAIQWTAGVFYQRARQDEWRDTYEIATPNIAGLETNDLYTDTLFGAFGNLTLPLSEHLRARLGARLDKTRAAFTEWAGGFAYPGVPATSRSETQDTPVSPQLDFQYQPDPHHFFYTTLAKGFRIGGTNAALPSYCGLRSPPAPYRPDSVWSYEVGTKDALLGERLQLAASGYYLRWHSIQERVVLDCDFGYVANLGTAAGKGLDLTLEAHATEWLNVGLAAGFTDMRYTRSIVVGGDLLVVRGTVVGGVPSVPAPWNGTAYLKFHKSMDGFDLYTQVDDIVHSHNPGPFTETNPQALAYSPLYRADPAINQVNLQFGSSGANWDVHLFLNNALGSQPELQRDSDGFGSNLAYVYTLRPRTFGLASHLSF